MDVRLPNGIIIKGVPEGTSKEQIMQKAISSGKATAEDFAISMNGMPPTGSGEPEKKPTVAGKFGGFSEPDTSLATKLPEIGSAPELNELSVPAFKASFGLLATGDDSRLMESFTEQFGEDVSFNQDESGNTIVNLPSGQYALNKPGLSPQDIARGVFDIAALTPAGRATSLPSAIAKAGATRGGIEGGAASVGAGFDPTEIAKEAALGGVGKIAEDIVMGGVRAVRGSLLDKDKQLIETAEQSGVPLMTTDVVAPDTLAGKLAQSTGEVIPVAGTGGNRAAQQAARENLAESFASQYTPKYDEVVQGLKNQQSKVKNAAGSRLEGIKNKMSEFGDIDTISSIDAIDDEIARLTAKGSVPDTETVSSLNQYREALLEGQDFESLRNLRTDFRERVKGERNVMPNKSQAAINRIYSGMSKDLDDAVNLNLGGEALSKYKAANSVFAEEAAKVKNTKIKGILQKGDMTPEQAGTMLFSQKPSDIKNIYQSLDNQGRKAARATVLSKAIADSSKRVGGLTPNTLASELGKYQSQYNIMFKGNDKKEIEGLIELLNATRRAQDAKVSTPTGQMLLGPLGGYAAFTDLASTLGGGLSIGGFARAYESPVVRNSLIRLKNSPKGSKAYDSALQAASESLRTLLIAQPESE